ncbi:unnamed protein product [Ixodes pacificus]
MHSLIIAQLPCESDNYPSTCHILPKKLQTWRQYLYYTSSKNKKKYFAPIEPGTFTLKNLSPKPHNCPSCFHLYCRGSADCCPVIS